MFKLMGLNQQKFKPYVTQAFAVLYHTGTHPFSTCEIVEQFPAEDLKLYSTAFQCFIRTESLIMYELLEQT